ncbi:MAG: hypothetical protein B6226_00100 [Candidatus Cloacimonetes bacterium 4572_65]|nr:MAG: hypothetical protein B6226_00100 [Candidatus Cloacimonetes bacterium 4572_65]
MLKGRKITLTVTSFYEAGYYNNDGLNDKYHGVGVDFKLYFDKVTISAIGLGVAYNINSEKFYPNVTIGFGEF